MEMLATPAAKRVSNRGRNGGQIEVEMDAKSRSKRTPIRVRNEHQHEIETDVRPEAPPSSFSIFTAAAGRPTAAAKIEKNRQNGEKY